MWCPSCSTAAMDDCVLGSIFTYFLQGTCNETGHPDLPFMVSKAKEWDVVNKHVAWYWYSPVLGSSCALLLWGDYHPFQMAHKLSHFPLTLSCHYNSSSRKHSGGGGKTQTDPRLPKKQIRQVIAPACHRAPLNWTRWTQEPTSASATNPAGLTTEVKGYQPLFWERS